MFRRAFKPALAVAVPTVAGYWYYRHRQQDAESFDISFGERVNGKAQMTTKTFQMMSMAEADARIRERAVEHTITRPGIVWRHSTASVASNDPIEDATANQVIRRDEGDGDLLFFAVMDGHGGTHTSQLLSRVLINAVALELEALKTKSASWARSVKGAVWKAEPTVDIHAAPGEPTRVASAIQRAFLSLDAELIAAPVRVLAANLDGDKSKLDVPDLSQHPLALPSMLPALSGSCAILALLDTAKKNLYVASTGDCRAVAGIWEPETDGKGHWRVEVLSEDQTGRNPNEAARIRAEHPPEEAADVIRHGRVLGGLEPTRAFGDARYKWSSGLYETLARAFLGDRKVRTPNPLNKTPPYVTSRPIVQHRSLEIPSGSATDDQRALRFVVLATDGLWDELSSEEVVRLVGGQLSGLKHRGAVPKSELATLVPTTTGTASVEGKTARREGSSEKWTFVDENPSAHLIRNAFGGGDTDELRRRLSILAPYSRRYRDDVTVTVVWWEAGNDPTPEIASVSVARDEVKAKL
ncbi:PPM-type phosphatase domain-containing protein [Mycena kentingensis (nom. inval.)]|nr:PPM-type phosphatase domain-containing protein [Mycena kentingensis (nom. inval.)]